MMFIVCLCALVACKPQNNPEEATASPVDSTAMQPEAAPASSFNTALDAAKLDPAHHKVLSDSLGIRMLEVTFKPGESSMLHAHPDFALYVVEGGTLEITAKDGTKSVTEAKAGTANILTGTEHSPKNIGKTPVKLILFEVDRPRPGAGAAPAFDAALDATKVDPAHYKVLKDSLGIRVLEINYKPGESSAFHAHPDNAFYVIGGGSVQMTAKDGAKQVLELKNGQTAVGGGGEHTPKNVGKTAMKAILVEVQRPRN